MLHCSSTTKSIMRRTSSSSRFPILGGRSYENRRIRDTRNSRGECRSRRLVPPRCAGQGALSGTSLHSIIRAVADGHIEIDDATRSVEKQCSAEVALEPSHHRVEVVDADDMPSSQLAAVLSNLAGKQYVAAARHVDSEVYATIRSMLPGVQYHGGARMLLYTDPNSNLPKVNKLPGHVAIVCGSGADVQMAYEANVALQLQGGYSTMIRDMSPTKLGQLVGRKPQLQAADAVIVCCGEQPALAGLILGLVDVPVVAIPGTGDRPDPNLAVATQGACATAPGDGVSAANVAARTLHVAQQYIQHRKGRVEDHVDNSMDVDTMLTQDEYLDRQPVARSSTHGDSAFDSAFINTHANGHHSSGRAMIGKHVTGTAVKGM